MTLPSHLFLSSSDGALYDTRVSAWSGLPPLRSNYKMSHRDIDSVADLKATLRAGQYAWPGGYPMYFLASDGEAISFESARENFREIAQAIADHDNSGWRIVAVDINYENPALYCAHSGKRIESAYAEDDAIENGGTGELTV